MSLDRYVFTHLNGILMTFDRPLRMPNGQKDKKSISMHLYAFKQSHKCQKVADNKLRNTLHLLVS